MAKKEGYRHYELELDVVELIDQQKKEFGISKDFTINKSIEYYFKNRVEEPESEDYNFSSKGRKSIYIYLNKENNNLLGLESKRISKSFNNIINEAVKFYLKNKV
jgi:hypothetical protein